LSAGPGQARLLVARNMLQHGEHRDNVKWPIVGEIGGKHPLQQVEIRPHLTFPHIRIQAHSLTNQVAQALEESPVGAADVQDAIALCDELPGLVDPPVLRYSVEPFHN
jgi:hypothetical protein